jgi:hypothetical protein
MEGSMDLWLYVAYTLVHGVLAGLLIRRWPGRPAVGWMILLLISFGLIYDNAILSLGGLIGFGPALEALSGLRFLLHALLTPLLCLYAVELLPHAGVRRAVVLRARYAAGMLTLGLIAFGLLAEYLPLRLAPVRLNGVARYMAVDHGPPVPAIVATLVLIGVGGMLWRRTGWPWLALGALVMFGGSAAAASWSPVTGSAMEVALLASLVATERWAQAQPPPAAAAATTPAGQGDLGAPTV